VRRRHDEIKDYISMEAIQKRKVHGGLGRFAATRRGAMTIAAVAAALAGAVLLVFISQYKHDVQGGTVERSALVANQLIPRGTSGSVVVSEGLSKATTVQQDNLQAGALASAAGLAGKVATHDIYPGEQITAADFASDADPLRGKLTGDQRAISVPVDSAHGLIGEIRAGDTVDVLASFNAGASATGSSQPELRTLVQNVLVLQTPSGSTNATGTTTQNLTVRVTGAQAAQIAFAADNGKVWFVLRPPAGATNDRPSSVTLAALMAGATTTGVGR
jgi:Flp pilus assembly protein CpaB